jgi:peptidyl-prolyl cis-trans isomerase A (cyclophilin A)
MSTRSLAVAFALPFALALAGCLTMRGEPLPRVTIVTEYGEITAELYPDRAPVTVANFLRYVEAGHFTNGNFFRTVRPDNQPNDSIRIAVIQASVDPARNRDRFPAIPLERTSVTGVTHEDGTLSMARSGPDTATSSFSICVGPQPSLDFAGKRNPDGQGFAAFGRVVDGMDVVRRIWQQPAQGQNLTPRVRILRIDVVGS